MLSKVNCQNTILVTGCAGFIGSKVCELLSENGTKVIGIDNINSAYSIKLKEWRLEKLKLLKNFTFIKLDITELSSLKEIFQQFHFDGVINLAARAGVRESVKNPWIYIDTNIKGTVNLLELCKEFDVKKFVLASTSSVYGKSKIPFSENGNSEHQLSPYAATKKSAECLAYTYHYLYGIDVTVLRYFTVYGPAGRPDMTPFKFTELINRNLPIPVYGDGTQKRDFTYIDDIARGSISALKPLGYEIINLGSDNPVELSYLIQLIEKNLGKKARIDFQSAYPADAPATWADISKAKEILNWTPMISIEQGVQNTVKWHLENQEWLKCISL